MVVHLSGQSHHNMSQQATRLFPQKSDGFALSSWLVEASAYNAILCYSKGAAIYNHAFQWVFAGVYASIQRSVVVATL